MLAKAWKSMAQYESPIIILLLSVLIVVYGWILFAPDHDNVPKVLPMFVIERDTLSLWKQWNSDRQVKAKEWGGGNDYWSKMGGSGADDYFDDARGSKGGVNGNYDTGPNIPSTKYRCPPHPPDWITIRSELNYKYMWMHTGEDMLMGATATLDTPLHHKAFEVMPVKENCMDGGWVRLREADSKGFLYMVPSTKKEGMISLGEGEWSVKIGSDSVADTVEDATYHWLLEEDGYLMNNGSMAFANVFAENEYTVRGHSSGWNRDKAAGREYSAQVQFQFVNESMVHAALALEAEEIAEAEEEDKKYVEQIAALPSSKPAAERDVDGRGKGKNEKWVISMGLYGTREKYTHGAIKNAEMAKVYFPGWICRYYVTSDVPETVIQQLKDLGAEIIPIPSGQGYISGMFWRFLVASDETVDRYIIRDVDSRPNARDRLAVEEWINTDFPVHILRDHVNHCIPMNGGMWGGVKGILSSMQAKVEKWEAKDEYMDDLRFLEDAVWPDIEHKQLSHDSYCCDRYSNTHPFPTQRNKVYQHVGQVFSHSDEPRLLDIDGFIRGVPVPGMCRKEPKWIYG